MLLYPWPAKWPVGLRPLVEDHPLSEPAGIWLGDFVYLDGDEVELVDESDVDGEVYGVLAEWPYEKNLWAAPWVKIGSLIEDYILLYCVSRSIVFALEGSRAPVEGDVGEEYGLAMNADGQWMLDLDETVNTWFEVTDVSIPRGLFFVKVLAARIQT